MRFLAAFATILFSSTAAFAAEPSPELFTKLDKNSDGKLVASEVGDDQKPAFERMLRLGDADKNGELSRDEFQKAAASKDAPVTDVSSLDKAGRGKGDRPTMQRMLKQLDKNGDGKISKDEAEGRPRLLKLMERKGSDSLSANDLPELGGKGVKGGDGAPGAPPAAGKVGDIAAPGPAGDRPAPKFLSLLDADKDGRVSKAEWAKASDVFGQLDEDGDGQLDRREILGPPPGEPREMAAAKAKGKGKKAERKALKGKPQTPAAPGKPGASGEERPNLVRLLKTADKNGDGKLTAEELPERLKARLPKLDKNGDGALDKQELEQAPGRPGKKKGGKAAASDTSATS